MGNSSVWTPERRAKQAEAIRRWKPWEQSTGPKSEAGKARSSQNAVRFGSRPALRAIGRHSQLVERIIRLEAKRTGKKPFAPDSTRSKNYGLSPEEHSELASLHKKQEQSFQEMMQEINSTVDWDEIRLPFETDNEP